MRRPQVIAHRGASSERPENTLSAFLRALELGADAVELDVHATRDGVVVVHHDANVRMPAADGRVANVRQIRDLTLDELGTFDVGTGERVPTLAAVLDAVGSRADVYVEIKGCDIESLVVETIRRSAARARCAVHSFDHRAIKRMRALAPEIPGGILLASSVLVDPGALLASADARDFWMEWQWVDEQFVRDVHEAGGRVIAWTPWDRHDILQLASDGVDGICADDVTALIDDLRQMAPGAEAR